MRRTGIVFLALTALVTLFGCGTRPASTPDASAKISKAKEEIEEASKATAEAVRAQRDEYLREMTDRLDELDVKYEALKDRAAKAEGQSQKDLEQKLEHVKVKREAALRTLDELKEAGADRWEKVKEGAGKALDDLKTAFE